MNEQILFSLEAILIDFFAMYGYSTILCLVLSMFIKNDFLKKFDLRTTRFIYFIGIVYFLLWIVNTIIEINIVDEETKNYLLKRLLGEYWVFFWLQSLLILFITQLLRSKTVQKNIFLRLLFSFLFIVSIERIIIVVTAFHRDYLPSSWTMSSSIYSSNFLAESAMRFFMFLLFIGIFTVIRQKINEYKNKKTK